MAFAPMKFKKNDIDKWFGQNIKITASVYREVKEEHGKYSFGDITEAALHGDVKAVRHLHAALRKYYKSPWREILTSVVKASLEAKPQIPIKWSFDPPAKRSAAKRIDVSYDKPSNSFTIRLKGYFPSPWDPTP